MRFSGLQPDLQQWIREAAGNGHDLRSMTAALVKAGYQPSVSTAVREYLTDLAGDPPPTQREAKPISLQAGAAVNPSARFRLFEHQENTLWVEDRELQVLLNLDRPNITLFANVLSDSECDALIAMSRSQLRPSRVVNGQHGTFDLDQVRTSFGTSFRRGETPLIDDVESRISALLNIPVERGEPIQVLHYSPGAEYRPHYDYFPPQQAGSRGVLAAGGQRVATFLLYLNDVEAGGATVFPHVGLDVLPRKGCGLLFSYADDADGLDALTLHGGSPVLAGEKWVATKWFRQREYVARAS